MNVRGSEVVFKYGGRRKDINADTFLYSLASITTIVQEVNRELGTGRPLDIKIKAQEPASFDFQLALLGYGMFEAAKPLLTLENFKTAKELLTAVISLFKLRKAEASGTLHLNQQGGSVTFQDSDGNQITVTQNVYNLYAENVTINESLDKNFKKLNDDPNVSSFEVLDKKGKPYFEVRRKDFSKMLAVGDADLPAIEEVKAERDHIVIPNAKLTVMRASFHPDLPWNVIFEGNKVPARLDDPDFQERVIRRRDLFGAGDILECDFQINRILDPIVKVMMNRSYKILKVHDHKPADEQMHLLNGVPGIDDGDDAVDETDLPI